MRVCVVWLPLAAQASWQRQRRTLLRIGCELPNLEQKDEGSLEVVRDNARDRLEMLTYRTQPPDGGQRKCWMVELVQGGLGSCPTP